MPEKTSEVVVRYKPGAVVMENGEPKRDGDGKVVREAPIPVKTVEIKVLTTPEAMDADDFALAVSPTGEPSQDNRVRAFALCAVRRINKETVLRPRDLESFTNLRDRFEPDELMRLSVAHLAFSRKVDEDDDPKDSPAEKP